MAVQTFAAITVGSFELELGIYELSARNGLRRVDEVRHVIGLGKDTYSTGKISYELVEELCRVLEDFVKIMNTYKVTDYRAYGTSAKKQTDYSGSDSGEDRAEHSCDQQLGTAPD